MIQLQQCKAGRAILGWTQADLSAASGVSLRALQEFEAGSRKPNQTTLQALTAALEGAGVVFIGESAKLYIGGLRGVAIDPRKIGKGGSLE